LLAVSGVSIAAGAVEIRKLGATNLLYKFCPAGAVPSLHAAGAELKPMTF
jgi:hypothetical protein